MNRCTGMIKHYKGIIQHYKGIVRVVSAYYAIMLSVPPAGAQPLIMQDDILHYERAGGAQRLPRAYALYNDYTR
jgi:hypothetical protein